MSDDPAATAPTEPHLALPSRRYTSTVVAHRALAPSAYELVLTRDGLTFVPGMLVTLHGEDALEDRDYTICSGIHDPHLHVLYRYIPTGRLTSQLVRLTPGDTIDVTGPYGQFVMREPTRASVFIATGTGIAPCRSFVRSHADLDLTILQGSRTREDLFYAEEFEPHAYFPCVSREPHAGFQGRVTDRLRDLQLLPDAHYYLCGAYEMIHDVITLLKERDIEPGRIFTEAYYYRAGA